MEKYTVGVDFGTLSARAVIVSNETGKIVSSSEYSYPHGVMTESLPGGAPLGENFALQHPKDYVAALGATVKAAVKESGINPENINGIGMDFTSCTMLPIDQAGKPLCLKEEFMNEPHAYAKLWKHHGAEKEAEKITALAKERGEKWLRLYGGKVSSEWMLLKIAETLSSSPKVYDAADEFIEAADYLTLVLTGNKVKSSCMAGYKALWQKSGGYPDGEFMATIDPRLRDLVKTKLKYPVAPCGSLAGEISEEGARLTGLLPGTKVAVPIIDAHSALPAAGIAEDGKLMCIIGTSSCHIIMDRKTKVLPGICGAVEDGIIEGYTAYECGQAAVGDIFSWFMRNSLPESICGEARKSGKSVFALMAEKAEKVPAGSNGITVLDWWNGNRTPYADYSLTGVMAGLKLTTRPEEIYRAILEATAFGTRRILKLYEDGKIKVREVYASGGIAEKDAFLMQIYADVLGREIKVPVGSYAASRGSAVLAAYAAGNFSSPAEAASVMADKEFKRYIPDMKKTAEYEVPYKKYLELSDYFSGL